MQDLLRIIADGAPLSTRQAEDAMRLLMRGEAEPEHAAGLLLGLRARGETVDELVGFTRIMREYAVGVELDDPHAVDLCGTGGDGSDTFNISTTAAFVVAGAGVTVAKHGNRSVSSSCGSADVLEGLGVNIELRKAGVEYCLREAGIAFLFAPYFHPAMRHVMPVRKKLGVRTFFNILGPLCNPAGVRRQLVGAFNVETAQKMVSILARLDAEHVVGVHAHDGLDELSTTGPTQVFEYINGNPTPDDEPLATPHSRTIEPELHALARASMDDLKGGSLEANTAIFRDVLGGTRGPQRDIVVLNAAYALHASGAFDDLDACFDAARASIDDGAATAALDALIQASHDAPTA